MNVELGQRLKEERERARFTQPQLADLAGAAKRTVVDWEKGASSPTAVQLARLADAGIDVLYVITKQRSPPIESGFEARVQALRDATLAAEKAGIPELRDALYLSRESATLLANYNRCGPEDQIAIQRLAEAAATAYAANQAKRKRPAQLHVNDDSPPYGKRSRRE